MLAAQPGVVLFLTRSANLVYYLHMSVQYIKLTLHHTNVYIFIW